MVRTAVIERLRTLRASDGDAQLFDEARSALAEGTTDGVRRAIASLKRAEARTEIKEILGALLLLRDLGGD